MDDIRIFLLAMKEGWRWQEDGFYFCEKWRLEDQLAGKSATRRTAEQLVKSMRSILEFLVFTMEIGEEFRDGKLPTLDTKIWIESGRKIMYEFFEKTMAANVLIQAKSALSDQVKVASLTQEVVRRLKHTRLELPHSSRMDVLESFSQKMSNSGHMNAFIKRILVAGICKYVRMVRNSQLDKNNKQFKSLHQPSGSSLSRFRRKILARQTWYKDKKRKLETKDQ